MSKLCVYACIWVYISKYDAWISHSQFSSFPDQAALAHSRKITQQTHHLNFHLNLILEVVLPPLIIHTHIYKQRRKINMPLPPSGGGAGGGDGGGASGVHPLLAKGWSFLPSHKRSPNYHQRST